MGFILFKNHPGDLLEIVNFKKRITVIKIDPFNLTVTNVKLTPDLEFKIYVNVPEDNEFRRNLVFTLNELSKKNFILKYVI